MHMHLGMKYLSTLIQPDNSPGGFHLTGKLAKVLHANLKLSNWLFYSYMYNVRYIISQYCKAFNFIFNAAFGSINSRTS